MLCDSCGKKDAFLHYTKIANGKIEKYHLCENCSIDVQGFYFDKSFDMNQIFAGFIDSIQEHYKQEHEEDELDLKCSNCGLSYLEFKSKGKLGCSNCYKDFKYKLDPLISGLHGHDRHKGKIPKRSSEKIFLKREEDTLKMELETAIKEEEFEKAAVIRDNLKGLRIKLDNYKG